MKRKEIERFEVDPNLGLNEGQVSSRKESKLFNETKHIQNRHLPSIILTDILYFFNLVALVVLVLVIISGNWFAVVSLVALLASVAINLVVDIKNRHSIKYPEHKVTVIRNGAEIQIKETAIVLDDIVVARSGENIWLDGKIVDGSIYVDDSFVSGETAMCQKNVGDEIKAGTVIVLGEAKICVESVNKNNSIIQIHNASKKIVRRRPQSVTTLGLVLNVISVFILAVLFVFLLNILSSNTLTNVFDLTQKLYGYSGRLVSLLPSSLLLFVALLRLVCTRQMNKNDINVRNVRTIESLARSDVVCFDKTGILTDGTETVSKIISYGFYDQNEIRRIILNVLRATNDSDPASKAIRNTLSGKAMRRSIAVLPFNGNNNYCAATFSGIETFVIGAPYQLDILNKQAIISRYEEFVNQGFHTLIIGRSTKLIKENKVNGVVEVLGFVLLKNSIRENAKEVVEYLNKQGKTIKVISGDEPETTSLIAAQTGVIDADKFISLKGMDDEQVKDAALKYTVFGHASAEQKELIIQSLQKQNHVVGMIGDGINDVLALKRADCSITIASGDDGAKVVSHVILKNDDISKIPEVVNAASTMVSNIEKASIMFFAKIFFSFLATLAFIVLDFSNIESFAYPFINTQFYITDVFITFVPLLLLLFVRQDSCISKHFAKSVFYKTIPVTFMLAIITTIPFIALSLDAANLFYFGIYSDEAASTMSVVLLSLTFLAVLYKLLLPHNSKRIGVFLISFASVVLCFIVSYLLTLYAGKDFIFELNLPILTAYNWFFILISFVVVITFFFAISYIVEVTKGEHLDVKNQSRSR